MNIARVLSRRKSLCGGRGGSILKLVQCKVLHKLLGVGDAWPSAQFY